MHSALTFLRRLRLPDGTVSAPNPGREPGLVKNGQSSGVQPSLQVHTGDSIGSVSTRNVGKTPFLTIFPSEAIFLISDVSPHIPLVKLNTIFLNEYNMSTLYLLSFHTFIKSWWG